MLWILQGRLIRFPEHALSISVLSNNSYITSQLLNHIDDLAKVLLPKSDTPNSIVPSIEKTTPYTSNETTKLSQYIGDYQIQPGLVFNVKKVNKSLQLSITGQQNDIKLRMRGPNEYELMDSDNSYYIVFDTNSDQSQFIRYFQGDFEYKGTRIELVKFDKSAINLDKYEGVYYSPELNTVYKIVNKQGQLQAEHARNTPTYLKIFQPEIFVSSKPFFQQAKFILSDAHLVTGMLLSGSRTKDIDFIKLAFSAD